MRKFENYDLISRNSNLKQDFKLSEGLERKLIKLSYQTVLTFLKNVFPLFDNETSCEECTDKFIKLFSVAKKQNLISRGGVPEKNYLLLSMTAQLLNPTLYVESGFFKGSSIHAVSQSKKLRRIIGFDPKHTNYRAILPKHLNVSLFKSDFADYDFNEEDLSLSLLYFDDHINTAERIIQASDKGFKNLIFDDSCGLMGTVERKFPSMPSLFFIENIENFSKNDEILWSKQGKKKLNFFNLFDINIKRKKSYLSFKFDEASISLCREAKNRILSITKMPDLNDFIKTNNLTTNDVTQHFVVLK